MRCLKAAFEFSHGLRTSERTLLLQLGFSLYVKSLVMLQLCCVFLDQHELQRRFAFDIVGGVVDRTVMLFVVAVNNQSPVFCLANSLLGACLMFRIARSRTASEFLFSRPT